MEMTFRGDLHCLLINIIMVGFIIWIIGIALTIKAATEIWALNGAVEKKLIAIVLIILTSWIGLALYYFYAKERMPEWIR